MYSLLKYILLYHYLYVYKGRPEPGLFWTSFSMRTDCSLDRSHRYVVCFMHAMLAYMCMIYLMFVVYALVNLYTIHYFVSSIDYGLRLLLLRRCILQYPTRVHRATDPAVNIPTWVSVHYILHRQSRLAITAANGLPIYRRIFPCFSLIYALFAGCTGCICYDIWTDILLPELRCQCHHLYNTQCGVQRLA